MARNKLAGPLRLTSKPQHLERGWRRALSFVADYPVGKQERANLLEANFVHGSAGNRNNPTGINGRTKLRDATRSAPAAATRQPNPVGMSLMEELDLRGDGSSED